MKPVPSQAKWQEWSDVPKASHRRCTEVASSGGTLFEGLLCVLRGVLAAHSGQSPPPSSVRTPTVTWGDGTGRKEAKRDTGGKCLARGMRLLGVQQWHPSLPRCVIAVQEARVRRCALGMSRRWLLFHQAVVPSGRRSRHVKPVNAVFAALCY